MKASPQPAIEIVSPEIALIDAARKDPASFEPLYVKYYRTVLGFIYNRVERKDDAFDLTSQTFTKALTAIAKYRHQGKPFSSWLLTIAYNEVNAFYNAGKKNRSIDIESTSVKYLADEAGVSKEELLVRMEKVLEQMDPDDLQLVQMRFFESRPFKEIAEILEITENNAKVKLYRVLEKMKKLLR